MGHKTSAPLLICESPRWQQALWKTCPNHGGTFTLQPPLRGPGAERGQTAQILNYCRKKCHKPMISRRKQTRMFITVHVCKTRMSTIMSRRHMEVQPGRAHRPSAHSLTASFRSTQGSRDWGFSCYSAHRARLALSAPNVQMHLIPRSSSR